MTETKFMSKFRQLYDLALEADDKDAEKLLTEINNLAPEVENILNRAKLAPLSSLRGFPSFDACPGVSLYGKIDSDLGEIANVDTMLHIKSHLQNYLKEVGEWMDMIEPQLLGQTISVPPGSALETGLKLAQVLSPNDDDDQDLRKLKRLYQGLLDDIRRALEAALSKKNEDAQDFVQAALSKFFPQSVNADSEQDPLRKVHMLDPN